MMSAFCERKTQWLEKQAIAESGIKGVHMALVRKVQDEKEVLKERLASALRRESFWRERADRRSRVDHHGGGGVPVDVCTAAHQV